MTPGNELDWPPDSSDKAYFATTLRTQTGSMKRLKKMGFKKLGSWTRDTGSKLILWGYFPREKKKSEGKYEVKEDDELLILASACVYLVVKGVRRSLRTYHTPRAEEVLFTPTVPTMESLPKTYLANYTLQEIGSNEDEWEVIPSNSHGTELGGES
jgi:hypothetical protein